MKEIDINTWKRREHFAFFSRMDYPHFNICFDVDISNLLPFIKSNNYSFYYSMIYLSTISANQVEEFRYRIRNEKVILHDLLNPSFSDMDNNGDLFKMITVDLCDKLANFNKNSKLKSLNQKEYFIASDFANRDDYIYFTSIPWISFTHISHTINLNKNDSVPRISWGKYYKESSKIILPFSVQVNHSFVDGIHIGKFKEILEKNMNIVYEL